MNPIPHAVACISSLVIPASMKMSAETRFEKYVLPEPMSGCWLWIGGSSNGYGMFGSREPGKNPVVKAHRFSWGLRNGPIPPGLGVLHKCDNTLCVNPDHLFLGDQMANNHDCIRKGRKVWRKGTDCPQTKLTPEMVLHARNMRDSGWQYKQIAKIYRVSPTTLRQAILGQSWKHLSP